MTHPVSRLLVLLACLGLSAPLSCYAERRTETIDRRVATLIGKMLDHATELQAFADFEALGCPAVPAIIKQMDDRRILPDSANFT